jgi:hypothetical protein
MQEEDKTQDEISDYNVIDKDQLSLELNQDDFDEFTYKTLQAVQSIIFSTIDKVGLRGVIITSKPVNQFILSIEEEIYNREQQAKINNLLEQGIVVVYDFNGDDLLDKYNTMMFKKFTEYTEVIYIVDFKSSLATFIDSLNNTIINDKEGCYKQFNEVYKDIYKKDVIW